MSVTKTLHLYVYLSFMNKKKEPKKLKKKKNDKDHSPSYLLPIFIQKIDESNDGFAKKMVERIMCDITQKQIKNQILNIQKQNVPSQHTCILKKTTKTSNLRQEKQFGKCKYC